MQHNIVYFASEVISLLAQKYGILSELIKNEKPLTSFEWSTKLWATDECTFQIWKRHIQQVNTMLCNFIEIGVWHGYSPVNLLHISRTPFPKNTFRGLLLNFEWLWNDQWSFTLENLPSSSLTKPGNKMLRKGYGY